MIITLSHSGPECMRRGVYSITYLMFDYDFGSIIAMYGFT